MLAWTVLLASTLVLATLFQAAAESALGGPIATTSAPGGVSPDPVAAGDDAPGPGASCAELIALFGPYNRWLFSGGPQGPCSLVPDATAPTGQVSPATTALADGDDVRARFLASVRAQGLAAFADPPQKNCVPPHC